MGLGRSEHAGDSLPFSHKGELMNERSRHAISSRARRQRLWGLAGGVGIATVVFAGTASVGTASAATGHGLSSAGFKGAVVACDNNYGCDHEGGPETGPPDRRVPRSAG